MHDFLSKLEPRYEKKGQVLLSENESISEILFFYTGSWCVGYELNKIAYFKIKIDSGTIDDAYRKGSIIGAYSATFNKRSPFAHKTLTVCEGFMIRRHNWNSILEDHPLMENEMKLNVIKLFRPMMEKLNNLKERHVA